MFILAFLPAIPRLHVMHTSGTHMFSEAPRLLDMISTIAMKGLVIVLIVFVWVAAARGRLDLRKHSNRQTVLLCACLALVPILILFWSSVGTDGSSDRTMELLEKAAEEDPRIVLVSLSRNFGH